MNSKLTTAVILTLCVSCAFCAPVGSEKKTDDKKTKDNEINVENYEDLGIEYGRYLQQVVQVLESDPEFKKKLEKADAEHVKSGAIAKDLDLVHHNVRSKLDELKREEIERLNLLLEEEKLMKGSSNSRRWRTQHDAEFEKRLRRYAHLDHKNPHTFEASDLKNLIHASTKDLEKIDQQRREEFKHYEMEKELQYEEGLRNMTEDQRKAAVKKHNDELEQKKHHPRVHHPGSKQQLEEVWEEQDHLPKDEFNPHTFFALHDVDGNGLLDEEEIKAVLVGEIDKLYKEKGGQGHVDETEKAEELERMREEVMKMGDKDKDRHISKEEFMKLTQDPSFEKDPEWKSVNEEPPYNPQEFEEYKQHRGEYSPDHYQFYPYQPEFEHHEGGYYPPDPTHPGQHPQQGYGQPHPGQYPPQGHDQPHPGQYPPQGHDQPHPGQYPPQGHPQQYGQQPPPGFVGQYPPQGPNQGHPGQYPPQGHPDQHQAQFAQGQYPPQGHGQPQQYQQMPPHQGQGSPQVVHNSLPQQGIPQHPPQGAPVGGAQHVPNSGNPSLASQQHVNVNHPNPAVNQPMSQQGVPSVDASNHANPSNVAAQNVPPPHHT